MSIYSEFVKFCKLEPVELGPLARVKYLQDPKMLGIYLSRYKFVSKMISGNDSVLEVGCGDGFGAAVVSESAKVLSLCDINSDLIPYAKQRHPNADVFLHDFCEASRGTFSFIYSLDVIEHISPEKTSDFLSNINKSLGRGGVFVFGTPSVESQRFVDEITSREHVNCRSQSDWLAALNAVFPRVFPFSMNDEVLHTGFAGMSHYLLFICIKDSSIN